METALVVLLALLTAALLLTAVAWALRDRASRFRRRTGSNDPGARREITLQITAANSGSPAVERLVRRVGDRVLHQEPHVDEVVIRAQDGSLLGEVHRRTDPLPKLTPPEEPPRRRSTSRPSVIPRGSHTLPPVGDAPDEPRRTVAERYDLPPAVEERLEDPDDPLGIVRAILRAADRPVQMVGEDSLRSGDVFIAAIGHRGGRPAQRKVLDEVYLQFRDSGAGVGLVISLEYMGASDVHRRELLVPELAHHGPDAIQTMADAVTVGGDPIAVLVELSDVAPSGTRRQP